MRYPHQPVMVNEVIASLMTDANGIYVDGTVGSGGHSEAIGRTLSSSGRLICLDWDPKALRLAYERLSRFGENITVIRANYADMGECLGGLGIEKVNGILLDLGVSSYQLEHSGRGFSFNRDEPLDMRMDPAKEVTAFQIINAFSLREIKTILKRYGEERKAGFIATAIDRERIKRPIKTSRQLAELIRQILPPPRAGGKDPATRSFQAIRIAVNNEIENLKRFLNDAPFLMVKGGRLVILSYHSIEDRMVKQAMVNWEKVCICPSDLPECACGKVSLFKRMQKKGIKPSEAEISINPRARSATLRAAERI